MFLCSLILWANCGIDGFCHTVTCASSQNFLTFVQFFFLIEDNCKRQSSISDILKIGNI